MARAKKDLGQNFLVDSVVINKILSLINPKEEENFLEIGPGKGALTEIISSRVKTLDGIEVDKDLIPKLRSLALLQNNLFIHELNILKVSLKNFSHNVCKYRVIGNLPYNLSTQIMLWSFQNSNEIKDIHYMFQKEFGERLVSKPGKKSYGRISVLSQYMFEGLPLFKITSDSFEPKPNVGSIFLKLTPHEGRNINSLESKKLQEVTNLLFSKRRKKISTSCKNILSNHELIDLDIDPNDRPESLTVEDFLRITNHLIKKQNV